MLLTLNEIREYLKKIDPKFTSYFIGKLDAKKDNSLGIYHLRRNGTPQIAIGGLLATNIFNKKVSLLVHGTKNNVDTENLANALYSSLLNADLSLFTSVDVCLLGLLCDGPINVGNDDHGICEYVIEFEIYYQKKKEDI